MAQSWPANLQQKLNLADFNYEIGSTIIKTNMGVGPVKRRRVSTKPIDKISCSIDLDFDDFTLFRDFFVTTLAGGTISFDYTNPFTGLTSEYKMDEPSISPLNGGRYFKVRMIWEVV